MIIDGKMINIDELLKETFMEVILNDISKIFKEK